jgi:hypothetical protein
MVTLTAQQQAQELGLVIEPGVVYEVGKRLALVHGAWEKRLLQQQGVPAYTIWTLREIESLSGVLWPARPTLAQVIAAFAGDAA